MGNPSRLRILRVTTLNAGLALAALLSPEALAADACAEKVELARERFRGLAIPTQKEAEQNCAHSRRAAFDRNQQRSLCIDAWRDLRFARDNYLKTLEAGCRDLEKEAKNCEKPSQAEAQACLERLARQGAEAQAAARVELEKAMARVDEIREQFHKRYSDLGDDRRFLEGKDPSDPSLATLMPRARDFGARTLRDYGRQAELVGHEQQLVANTAYLFREVAELESNDRLEAQRTLTGASQAAGQRANALGAGGGDGKESTITGRSDSDPAPSPGSSSQPMMMPPAAPQLAQGGPAAGSAVLPGGKSAPAAASPALPAGSAPDRALASLPRATSSSPASSPSAKEPSAQKDDVSLDSGRATPSAAFLSGRGGEGARALRLDAEPGTGKPAAAAASAPGPSRTVATRPQKKRGQHADDEGAPEKQPALPPGPSLLDAPLGLMGTSGQLGPSEMMMNEEGELTPEQLLGLGDLKGDAPLTEEEMALLGLSPGASPAEARTARTALAEQLRALSHSGATQSGIGSADSVGIFTRVRSLHVRAQKKGLVMRITKKL